MRIPKPYFMENEEWYFFDEKEDMYKLTKEAPKEAIESYNNFCELLYGNKKANNNITNKM